MKFSLGSTVRAFFTKSPLLYQQENLFMRLEINSRSPVGFQSDVDPCFVRRKAGPFAAAAPTAGGQATFGADAATIP